MVRAVLAPNPSALTLDGTWTYIVGRSRVAVIDPGPRSIEHLSAVVDEIGDGTTISILLTHSHRDHAAGARRLARRLGAPLLSGRGGTLTDGQRVETDHGELVALATPGHAPDHFAFHHPANGATFVGDLMLGGLDTTLVAPPGGDLGEYRASLERVRRLGSEILYPGHGPPFTDPDRAIEGYLQHRRDREEEVLAAVRAGATTIGAVVRAVYGTALAPGLRVAARGAVRAYLNELRAQGRLDDWRRRDCPNLE